MENKILATVGGEEVTQSDFHEFLQNVPREQQAYLSNPQAREYYLEQLLTLFMFAKDAEDRKLDEEEEIQKMLKNARRDILAQAAVRALMKDIDVEESEMQAHYEANKAQYKKGGTVRASHILVDSEEKCNEIKDKITSGETTFEEAAKEFSSCPSGQKGGDLGEFGRGQMVKEFEQAAFEGELNQVIGPVQTQFGYHLIKTVSREEEGQASFEEVKESIRRSLVQGKQSEVYAAHVQSLKAKYEIKHMD